MLAVLTLLIGVGVGLFWLVYYSFSQLLNGLADIEGQLSARLEELGALVSAGESIPAGIERIGGIVRGFLAAVLAQVVSMAAMGVVIMVAVVLVLLDSANLSTTLQGLFKRNEHLAGVRELPGNLVNYFVARTQINLFTGTAVMIFLFIMRVDYAALWGVLAFFLSYIPYIGLTVAAIPAVILAFAQQGIVSAVIVAIGYVVLNQVAEMILEPKITGARLSLKPWFVFLAMFVFARLMGPAGVLLAGPLTIFTVILFSVFDDTQWILGLIVDEKTSAMTDDSAASGGEQRREAKALQSRTNENASVKAKTGRSKTSAV